MVLIANRRQCQQLEAHLRIQQQHPLHCAAPGKFCHEIVAPEAIGPSCGLHDSSAQHGIAAHEQGDAHGTFIAHRGDLGRRPVGRDVSDRDG
jgi:DNA-binding IclR family transcriptional regulator